MKVIMYVTSTLKNTSPINQLYLIIKYLDQSKFYPLIVTLSSEPNDSRLNYFKSLGIKYISLKMSRLKGIFFAKQRLKKLISIYSPDIIHSQGFRSDTLIAKICKSIPWVITSHNCPMEDYPMTYNKFIGHWMASKQLSSMKKCKKVIACSITNSKILSTYGVMSMPIQNGIDFIKNNNTLNSHKFIHPIFICIGNLIAGKNVSFIINAFNLFSEKHAGTLIVLGDGVKMKELKALVTNDHVFFAGRVNNVNDYLSISDYFVSSSLSEGLPYAVLEALASGLPVFLSDIPSHQEIAIENKKACQIFELSNGTEGLCEYFLDAKNIFSQFDAKESIAIISDVFSAKRMSLKYQEVYSEL